MTDQSARPAPYPADIRAKGWRFELDYESIDQSETWALAGQAGELARPLLLMLWLTAWRQKPAGSLPADEGVIAALMGVSASTWAAVRDVLLRGWWLAEDGRLYHDTLTQRVIEMITKRRSDAARVAAWRAKKSAGHAADTQKSRVTNGAVRSEYDTGTGTSTGERNTEARTDRARAHADGQVPEGQPTQAGLICRAMKPYTPDVNPGHPDLIALIEAGLTVETAAAAAEGAKRKGRGFAYALATIVGQMRDAAQRRDQLAGLASSAAPAQPWHETAAGVKKRGAELGLVWSEDGWVNGEHLSFPAYRAKVFALAGHRPTEATA